LIFRLEMWSYLFIGIVFYTTSFPESVCETFTDLNDPTRKETVHKIFMEKVPDNTNQGTPSQGDSFAFPFFRNVGLPLMATLYIIGLNVGLPIWLGTIPNVLNSLDTYVITTIISWNPSLEIWQNAKSI
jgi:hypothetical protein